MDIFIAIVIFFTARALADDWRDRFNPSSRVYRFFDWLHRKTGWVGLWKWYAGTRDGPLKRFLKIPYDHWHSLQHILSACLAYICYQINGWWGVGAVIFVAFLWFPLLYNHWLIAKK